MATTKIVITKNSRPAQNVKVTLEYIGFTNLGFTKPFYTNSNGEAFVEHASTGKANVYVDGSKVGIINTPGQGGFNI